MDQPPPPREPLHAFDYFVHPNGRAQITCSNCGSPRFRFIDPVSRSVCSNCGFPLVDPKRGW